MVATDGLNGAMSDVLISAEDLLSNLATLRLFDIRWALTDPRHGVQAYEAGHIPGAVFVDLDHDLSAAQGDGRHPLPELATFERTLGRLGVDPDDDVVVYDDAGGAVAARMWWMLHSIGHRARLLDGGFDTWCRMGYPVEQGRVEPNPTTYRARHDFTGWVGHDAIPERVVVDVRAPERYTGEREPVDPKAGHIPGAVNLPTVDNLDQAGTFKSPAKLAKRFVDLPPTPVVSCGSGVNACHTAVAMVRAGMAMPDIYIGSFSDWSRRDLPVNSGAQP